MNSVLHADREQMLEQSRDIWEPLRGTRIFITGGTGFVGTWLLEAFTAASHALELNAQAVVLSRDPSSFRERVPHLATDPSVRVIPGDAETFDAPKGPFEFVIHAATQRATDASAGNPLSILENDRVATRRVLDFTRSTGVRRFLFTSSGAVYGDPRNLPREMTRIAESYPGSPDVTNANAAYGESKRLSEYTCASYARCFGFDVTIARLFAFVGPRLPLSEGYAVGNFVRDALARATIAVNGDGTARRSYLYASDLAVWLWTILVRGTSGRAYNVGSPHDVSIASLARTVAQTLAPETAVTIAQRPEPGAQPHTYVPDTTRAERELGLRPTVSLEDALRRTYDYYTIEGLPTP